MSGFAKVQNLNGTDFEEPLVRIDNPAPGFFELSLQFLLPIVRHLIYTSIGVRYRYEVRRPPAARRRMDSPAA